MELWTDYDLSKAGNHQLSLNEHLPKLSAYLANTLVPRNDTIKITGQQRDKLHHKLDLSFRIISPAASVLDLNTTPRPRWPKVLLSIICLALLSIVGLVLRFSGWTFRKGIEDFDVCNGDSRTSISALIYLTNPLMWPA